MHFIPPPPIPRQLVEREVKFTGRPLLVCDIDETVVKFLDALDAFLAERDLHLDPRSFRLDGNVRRKRDGHPLSEIELWTLLDEFFVSRLRHFEPIEGTREILEELSERVDIVFLTNMDQRFYEDRAANLRDGGFRWRMLNSWGAKGLPAAHLAEASRSPLIFVDDLPAHISSVSQTVPGSAAIHYIRDERFAALSPPAPRNTARARDWKQVKRLIEVVIDAW